MATVPAASCTPEDLLAMPDGKGHELLNGTLMELNAGSVSSWIVGRLFILMQTYVVDADLCGRLREGSQPRSSGEFSFTGLSARPLKQPLFQRMTLRRLAESIKIQGDEKSVFGNAHRGTLPGISIVWLFPPVFTLGRRRCVVEPTQIKVSAIDMGNRGA